MKRILSIFIAVILLLYTFSIANASVQQDNTNNQVILLEDGGYIVVEYIDGLNTTRAAITRSKLFTRYNEADMIIWKAMLTGQFTYDGRTSTCTSCSCVVSDYDEGWYTISKTVWPDYNIAKATLEMGRRSLGVTVQRETHNLSMVCDRYGNVS